MIIKLKFAIKKIIIFILFLSSFFDLRSKYKELPFKIDIRNNVFFDPLGELNYEEYKHFPFNYAQGNFLKTKDSIKRSWVEILKGNYTYSKRFYLDGLPYVIPFFVRTQSPRLRLEVDKEILNSPSFHRNRVNYLKFDNCKEVLFNSADDFFLGKPILLIQTKKTKYKLILQIFIDGLSGSFLDDNGLVNLMPGTFNFFKNDHINTKFYSNSEWTLPSTANIMTGRYTVNHRFYDPDVNNPISNEFPIAAEFFEKEGYLTYFITSNWRQSPEYGYFRGVDRFQYVNASQRVVQAPEIIGNFIENCNSFNDRSQYAFISFFDLHESPGELGALNIDYQTSLNFKDLMNFQKSKVEKVESVFLQYNENSIIKYREKIKWLDSKLSELYDFINSKYQEDEVLVNLISDHGQSYLSYKRELLGKSRTQIPFMLKGNNCSEINSKLSSNIDILPTILDLSSIPFDQKFDGRSLLKKSDKDFVISEVIFPDQPYRVAIRNDEGTFYFVSKNLSEAKSSEEILNNGSFYHYKDGKKVSLSNDKSLHLKDKILRHTNKRYKNNY